MPASAPMPLSVPFPVASGPHASGTRIAQQPAHLLMRPQHRHGHSADYADPNQVQKPARSHHAHARLSEQMLSKPLPIKPEQDHDLYSRPPVDKTDAQRYRDKSLQKLEEREDRRGPSLDLPRGQAQSSSVGRSRSATMAAPPSSGSRGSTGARRKPVQASPAEYFEWAPGDEAQVISSPTANDMPTGTHKSRNRNIGVYRDPPVHPTDTWSRATAPKLSASVGHQPASQPSHYVISSSSLGRHHSASASVPAALPGSARTTIQNYPTTPTPANTSSSNQKIPFISSSTANTPTPKAQTFNNISTKQYKHSSVSNQDLATEERRRKLSHHRTASASTNPQSPSSCSTTGSSHADTLHSTHSQEPRQRRRGISDAAHQTYHIPVPMGRSEVSVVKIGGEDEERGRTKEKKDSSFIGRLRTRSNSFTKTLSNMISYPKYLKKDKEKEKEKDAKRLSKQQQQSQSHSNVGQGGSAILASASDNGHSFAYSYTSSNSTATSTSATSPISSHNHSAPPPPPPQPRPRKLLHSARDQQKMNDYRASPMTRAKNDLLDKHWGDVDLPRRESGFVPLQVQVSETRTRVAPMIPFMGEEPKPRRR